MKLAFSTLGCPEWTFDAILRAAQRDGFAGIEFRGLLGEIDLVNAPEFAPGQIAETRRRLEDAGVRAACLSSSVTVVASTGTPIDRVEAVAHAKRYLDLAHAVGAPCVRLFCGSIPATMTRLDAIALAADSLRQIGDYAQPRGVIAVLETHDAFIRTDQLMELVRATGHPAVQVLWDIHHPWRVAGESLDFSVTQLDGHIAATHVKDSLPTGDGDTYRYTLTGQGDVPLQAALHALKSRGYTGYLTLEWEKRWIPDLPPPEVAFPQYAAQMRTWLGEV